MRLAAFGILTACLTALSPIRAEAASSLCPQHFLGGAAPDFDRPVVAQGVVPLCNSGYAVLYSPLTNGPLVSAERLTREKIAEGARRRRDDDFRPDNRLPASMRMRLSDFQARGSCLDRGHMAPDKNQGSPSDAAETYYLSNMIPQSTDNNQRIWEGIESALRDLAERVGEVYVATGPIFEGATIQRLNGRIAIPTKLFKAFYVPRTGEVGVYVTHNGPGMDYWSLSIDQLRQLTGIDIFPAAPANARSTPSPSLPTPTPHFPTNREMEGRCTPVAIGNGLPPLSGSGGSPAASPTAPRPVDTSGIPSSGAATAAQTAVKEALADGASGLGRAILRRLTN